MRHEGGHGLSSGTARPRQRITFEKMPVRMALALADVVVIGRVDVSDADDALSEAGSARKRTKTRCA